MVGRTSNPRSFVQHRPGILQLRASLSSRLLAGHRPGVFGWVEALVLLLYTAVLAWTVAHHVQWGDEAQSWLLVRDCSFRDLLLHRLRYEGHPPLWHAVLALLQLAGVSYKGMNWAAAAFAVSGIFVLLRYAPFPLLFRALLPFTFFLQFQYAAVARGYVLFPLVLFGLAMLYRSNHPRPIAFSIVCGLFANLTLHGLVIASGFLFLYLRKVSRSNARAGHRPIAIWLRGAAPFALFVAFAAAVVFPPPDIGTVIQNKVSASRVQAFLHAVMPEQQLPVGAPPLDPLVPGPPLGPPLVVRANGWQHLVLAAIDAKPEHPSFEAKALRRGFALLSAATFPLAKSNLLACSFLVAFALWLWARRSLLLLLPWLGLLGFSGAIYIWEHHAGIPVLVLLAAAWIAFERPPTRGPAWISPVFGALTLLIVLLQIGWSIHAIYGETIGRYDPGLETEQFLTHELAGERIAAFSFEAVSIEPYLSYKLFSNQDHTFWVWSANTNIDQRRTEALRTNPDVVVVGDVIAEDEALLDQWLPLLPPGSSGHGAMIRFWLEHGYRETHTFCGERWMRGGISSLVCDHILERAQDLEGAGKR